MAAARLF